MGIWSVLFHPFCSMKVFKMIHTKQRHYIYFQEHIRRVIKENKIMQEIVIKS